MTNDATQFLTNLSQTTQLVVQTITPTVLPTVFTGSQPIIISANQSSGISTAVVLDLSSFQNTYTSHNLPPSVIIDNVSFASIVGSARVTGGAGANIAIGDNQNQFIVLGADDDTLYGGGGEDTVGSLGGDDTTYGDTGDDVVFGGSGNDTMSGGDGSDALNGGFGFDTALQSGSRSSYTTNIVSNKLYLTGTDGATDTFVDVELIKFDSGDSLFVAASEAEAVVYHLVKTWLGRDTNSAEISWAQSVSGKVSIEQIVTAFKGLPEAAGISSKTTAELMAGFDSNENIIKIYQARDVVANDSDNTGTMPIGSLSLNIDAKGGFDVLSLLGDGNNYAFEAKNGGIEVTYIADGSMSALNNLEAFSFSDTSSKLVAKSVAEGIVGRMFQAYFDRDASLGDWEIGIWALDNGIAADTIFEWFRSQSSIDEVGSTDSYIQAVYSNLLSREASASEVAYYQNKIDNEGLSRDWFVVELCGGSEAREFIDNIIEIG